MILYKLLEVCSSYWLYIHGKFFNIITAKCGPLIYLGKLHQKSITQVHTEENLIVLYFERQSHGI